MLVQFFNNTIEQSFLKALLSAVQLPKYKIVKDGDLIFNNYFYIYKGMIIKCTTSGAIGTNAKFEELEHYYFGDMNQNIEFKEFIRASYYSTELHKRFGEYLRCLRDLYDVDLMGMYNCFDYEVFTDVYIGWDATVKKNIIFSDTQNQSKVLAVPIKYNTNYTIYMTSDSPVYIAPILKLPSGKRAIDDSKDAFRTRFFGRTQFTNPIEVSIDLDENLSEYYKYEKYLYFIIQIDKDNKSSVVVLEGNYKNCNNLQIVSAQASNGSLTLPLIYKPALIQINDGVSYAYSNTIMQYLLHNAISNIDIIEGNISYAKKLLNFDNDVNYWDNNIKYSAFVKYLLNLKNQTYTEKDLLKVKKDCVDVTGYIDKQIEGWLNA